jgi:hypothetical protein
MTPVKFEDRSDVYELLNCDGYPVLMTKLEELKDIIGVSVLQCRFDNPQMILNEKAKYDGANYLLTELKAYLSKFKSDYEKSEGITKKG